MMRYCETFTPIGRLFLAGDESGLRRVSFPNRGPRAEITERWERTEEPFREAIAQLEAYFDRRLRWFDLPNRKELEIDSDQVLRSRTFPGLWIDVPGLVAKDHARLMATLNAGLATAEHADFCRRLSQKRQGT